MPKEEIFQENAHGEEGTGVEGFRNAKPRRQGGDRVELQARGVAKSPGTFHGIDQTTRNPKAYRVEIRLCRDWRGVKNGCGEKEDKPKNKEREVGRLRLRHRRTHSGDQRRQPRQLGEWHIQEWRESHLQNSYGQMTTAGRLGGTSRR